MMMHPTQNPIRHLITLGLVLTVLSGWSFSPATAADAPGESATVTGTVVNQNGEPAKRVLVTLMALPPAGDEIANGPAEEITATTDGNGKFEVTIEEPKARYRIRFEGKDYAPWEQEIQVEGGSRNEFDITIIDADVNQLQMAVKAFNAGVDALRQNDDETAWTEFERAQRLNPELAEAYLGLGRIAHRQSRLEVARDHLQRYLEFRPTDAKGLTVALAVAEEIGDQEWRGELAEALSETDDPKGVARVVFNQGVEALDADDRQLATEKIERAIELDPTLSQAHSILAALYYNAARYSEAVTSATQALELDPSDTQSHQVLYLAMLMLGDTEGAAAALDAFVAVDPEGAVEVMYRHASMGFEENGPSEQVTSVLERVISLNPEHPRAHYILGLCLVGTDPEGARAHLERFLELAPDDPEAASARDVLGFL